MRGALWPLPVLGVLVAVAAGILLPELDRSLGDQRERPAGFVFGGGASAARDSLAAIASSLISVTGLVFSLTVVALQLSSSQYSPRLLQTFVGDRYVQWTLAQLVLTFTFALVVLRTVRAESAETTAEGVDAFVPRLSVSLAYLLALISVVAVVLFLGHLARSLRVETMLRDVHDEATATIRREFGDERGADDRGTPPARPAGPGLPILAVSSGFLVEVDESALVGAAADADALLLLVPRFGDSVVEGTPVAHAWPTRPGARVDAEALRAAVGDGVHLALERTAARDVAYGLRKMVDIAVRALSPGVNDPTTAVHALSHVSAVLTDLLVRPLSPRELRDDDDRLRLVVRQWEAPTLIRLALEEPLHFASGQPAVLRRMAGLLREVAWRAPRGSADAQVRRLIRRVAEVAGESTDVPAEERDQWIADVDVALAGGWPAQWPWETGKPSARADLVH